MRRCPPAVAPDPNVGSGTFFRNSPSLPSVGTGAPEIRRTDGRAAFAAAPPTAALHLLHGLPALEPVDDMSHTMRTRWILLRDLAIFLGKLALDGAKDIVLSPLAIAAATVDVLVLGDRPGRLFYGVLRAGERFDRWLSLFSAAEKASALDDGLFGSSRAGSPTFLGRLEEIVIGREEDVDEARPGPEEPGAASAG